MTPNIDDNSLPLPHPRGNHLCHPQSHQDCMHLGWATYSWLGGIGGTEISGEEWGTLSLSSSVKVNGQQIQS